VPKQISSDKVLLALDPAKDADGLHPLNQGRWMQMKNWSTVLSSGVPLPCTPAGVMELLGQYGVALSGKNVVVVGRSPLVGKPLAMMLAASDATVTLCHSRTAAIGDVCRRADVLVAALGVPRFVTAEMVKPGAVVVDVGISRTDKGLVGDVDFNAVKDVAGFITPVPGGVGPMTVALLLWNTVLSAERSAG
jgi:methylenetetrahydrofolate dehydrogenase (NADP+) / methenyltetrahydrofolate cyclohydrolase